MSDKRKNRRLIEIATGFLLLSSILSILIAFLMNFDYNLPHITIEANFDYLSDSTSRQKISAALWILAGFFNLCLLSFYLILFQRFQKGMHILNGLFILAMAWCFGKMGLLQLAISNTAIENIEGIPIEQSANAIEIMMSMSSILLLKKIGITALGGFATVLSISHFRDSGFPTIGSLLAFLAGPVMITFIWINPDHILFTCGLAATCIGMLIIGAWLVNKGLFQKIT